MNDESEDESEKARATEAYLTPPALLYHYTSTDGLIGILQSGSIWATNLRYLNDVEEFEHGLGFLVPAFRKQIAAINSAPWANYLVEQFIEGLRAQAVYVSSFCEAGDLLSQWRGYAASNGFAIGFDTAPGAAPHHPRRFERVHYGAEGNQELADWTSQFVAESFFDVFPLPTMQRIVDASEDEGSGAREELAEMIHRFQTQGIGRAAHMCALLKDGAFQEEREWRITVPGLDEDNLKFRAGAMGLTPYLEVDLKTESGRLPIKSITVGPGPHLELRVAAVELLLRRLNYGQDVDVRASATPFRP